MYTSKHSFWRAVIVCCIIAMIMLVAYRIFDNAIDAFFQNIFSPTTSDLFTAPVISEWE